MYSKVFMSVPLSSVWPSPALTIILAISILLMGVGVYVYVRASTVQVRKEKIVTSQKKLKKLQLKEAQKKQQGGKFVQ